jgi:hypothetical protein
MNKLFINWRKMGYTTYQLVDFPTIGNMIRNCEEIGICDCIIFYIPMDGEHVHRNYVIFFTTVSQGTVGNMIHIIGTYPQ